MSGSKRPPGVDKSWAHFTLSLQTSSYNGSPVSGWRGELDTGPRRQTVAIWILFSIIPVLLFWSYPVFGPGMDVPEASKHAKKSTCQKLEDQKKVGKSLLFFCHFFEYASFLLFFFLNFGLCSVFFSFNYCGNQELIVCLLQGLLLSSQKRRAHRSVSFCCLNS